MGGCTNRKTLIGVLLAACLMAGTPASAARPHPVANIEAVRGEINNIERDLLLGRENQISAANQLKKIRRLVLLQQKEVEISKKRISELGMSLDDLAAQKKVLYSNIEQQKIELRARLRELTRLTESEALDASWLRDVESENQKSYFLAKTLGKELSNVARLRENVVQAQNLELRILEEKNRLDYYVQEMHSEIMLMSANEDVQKEIIRTNRTSRLEALSRVRSLRESEHELEQVLARFKPQLRADSKPQPYPQPLAVSSAIQKPLSSANILGLDLAALRGKLPFPVQGRVVSTFGKSYNPKTNLLTFQKGITIEAAPMVEVKAVSDGKVVFAGPLKNYGLIAIVEHPGQYYTLYGQMGSVAKTEGAEVKQGHVLGKTSGEPLYFEIRNRNVAINPMQWLLNGSITLSKQ